MEKKEFHSPIMGRNTITEIKKGQTGTGLLIEQDGFVSLDTHENKSLYESIKLDEESGNRRLPNPFIVSAVFQKYGIENANGRVYPESILKREVEKYRQAINERRAYGECYTPDAECLTVKGWMPIGDVKQGDKVLSLNTKTREIEVSEVVRKIERNVDEDLYYVKGSRIDELVTKGHKYPIYKKNGKFYGLFDAETLANGELSRQATSYIPTMEHKRRVILGKTKFTKRRYNGKVMCIELDTNHTWYVRVNRKEHWTGNCNHPDTSTIDVSRIAMNVVELHWEGRTLVGKMEIPITDGFRNLGIVSTCADQVAQCLISGLKIGVSSRGLGSVKQEMGRLVVGDDFELTCFDIVSQPSTPNAWLDMDERNLKPYIESKESDDSKIIKEDKFLKFKNWLNG